MFLFQLDASDLRLGSVYAGTGCTGWRDGGRGGPAERAVFADFRRRHAYSETGLDGETTWFGLLRVVFIDFGTLSFDLVGQNFHTSIRRGVAAGSAYLLTFPGCRPFSSILGQGLHPDFTVRYRQISALLCDQPETPNKHNTVQNFIYPIANICEVGIDSTLLRY